MKSGLPKGLVGLEHHVQRLRGNGNSGGSETDASTSTENLHQDERGVLQQHQQEPQQHMLLQSMLQSNNRAGVMQQQQLSNMGNMTPLNRAILDRQAQLAQHHQNLLLQQRAAVSQANKIAASIANPNDNSSGSNVDQARLTPSVYSYPLTTSDPLLRPQLLTRRANLDVTSSGAFFDKKAAANANNASMRSGRSSEQILAHLTRELKLHAPSTPTATMNDPQSSLESLDSRALMKRDLKLLEASGLTPSAGVMEDAYDSSEALISRSQPELSAQALIRSSEHYPRASTTAAIATTDSSSLASRSGSASNINYLRLIEQLQAENRELHCEVADLSNRVSRVNTLEHEMSKIQDAYQSLLKHSEKREALENAAKQRLKNIIAQLTEANKEVSDRHEAVLMQLMSGDPSNQNIAGLDIILRGEIARKDALVKQLMEQNKIILGAKERQDVEMAAQQETLEEQRAHIQVLDTALSNAQSQVLKLEEENLLKEGYAQRVKHMTRSLEQLQAAAEKREEMEKRLRVKLEGELRELREASSNQNRGARSDLGGEQETIDELKLCLKEAEERIVRLESDRADWEHRYLSEVALRDVAIDAASIPKDARIAALERNNANTERMMAEASKNKLKHFEEMQSAQRRIAELENSLKTVETQLAEERAMLSIMQSNQKTVTTPSVAAIPFITPQQQLLFGPMTPMHSRQTSSPLLPPHLTLPSSITNNPNNALSMLSANSLTIGGSRGLVVTTPLSVAGSHSNLFKASEQSFARVNLKAERNLLSEPIREGRRDSAPASVIGDKLHHQRVRNDLLRSEGSRSKQASPSPLSVPNAIASFDSQVGSSSSPVALSSTTSKTSNTSKKTVANIKDSPLNRLSTKQYSGTESPSIVHESLTTKEMAPTDTSILSASNIDGSLLRPEQDDNFTEVWDI